MNSVIGEGGVTGINALLPKLRERNRDGFIERIGLNIDCMRETIYAVVRLRGSGAMEKIVAHSFALCSPMNPP
ncbi:MAG: hypothetical protein ACR2IV_13730 [Bryobacteraceae bacterium]